VARYTALTDRACQRVVAPVQRLPIV